MIDERIIINTITNNIISYLSKLRYSFIKNIKLYLQKVIRHRKLLEILSQNKSKV